MRTWSELKDTIYNISIFLSILFVLSLFVLIGITIIFLASSRYGYAWISFIGVVFSSLMIYYLDKVTDLLDVAKYFD